MEEKLKIIGAILGGLGFALSCFNLWRSIKTDKRARSLILEQKKQELRNIALQGKIALVNGKIRLEELLVEVESQGSAVLVAHVQKHLSRLDSQLSAMQAALKDLSNDPNPEATYDEILKFFHVYISKANESVNPDLVEAQTNEFIYLIKRALEERKRAIEKGHDPDKVESAILPP